MRLSLIFHLDIEKEHGLLERASPDHVRQGSVLRPEPGSKQVDGGAMPYRMWKPLNCKSCDCGRPFRATPCEIEQDLIRVETIISWWIGAITWRSLAKSHPNSKRILTPVINAVSRKMNGEA